MKTRFDDKDFWLGELQSNSDLIETFVEKAKNEDRLTASRLIVNVLRNFIEAIINYVAITDGATYEDASSHRSVNEISINYVKSRRNKYELLAIFHDLINSSASHESVLIGDYAERLMLDYIPRLIKVKQFLHTKYAIDIVHNLKQFPLKLDGSTISFYSKIVEALKSYKIQEERIFTETFYVLSKKAKFINDFSFFEYTLSVVDDNRNKADKIIAFSTIDIFDNYALKIKSFDKIIEIFNLNSSVKIITDYEVAIRGCEFKKLGKIINVDANGFSYSEEYNRLMNHIKKERQSLADLVRLPPATFNDLLNIICYTRRGTILRNILFTSRKYVTRKCQGHNVLLYLLACMDNQTIERQIKTEDDKPLPFSDLQLSSSVIPFDKTPFCANLPNSSIDSEILFSTFNVNDHECELVKRELDIYSNANGLLYCPQAMFNNDENLASKAEQLKAITNNYAPFVIDFVCDDNNNKYLYLKENETILVEIINSLNKFINKETIIDYKNYVNEILKRGDVDVDDPTKKDALLNMFDGKSMFAIYGPAGTGKSHLAKLILSIIDNYSVLCISSTHASIQNLKRRIGGKSGKFVTVEKVVRGKTSQYKNYDFVIIDECSTISNADINKVLNRISPKLLLLMGDTYQIESIDFGNWFGLLTSFIPDDAYITLDHCYRTNDSVLKNLWGKVRNIEQGIHEYLKNHFISKPLNQDFFGKEQAEDGIILCLNYGGLFGINNINSMMQAKNEGKGIYFRQHIYKVGDPIIFKESKYYDNILYNNLKGKIVDIKDDHFKISFTVLAKDNLNVTTNNKEIRDVQHINGETLLTFDVYKCSEKEIAEDIKPYMVVPFNVAYASSIHKAQGLEFDSVDVLISDEIKEVITHNIFYTAITRAVKDLNIYWAPQCEQRVIENLTLRNYKNDERLLKKRFPNLIKYKYKID